MYSPPSLMSPRLHTLQSALETGNEYALAAFWQELTEHGTPLIEADVDNSSAVLVTFVWRARPELPGSASAPSVGLVVQQYRSSTDGIFVGKTVTPGSAVREIVVEGKRGYWIDGAPHSIAYFDAQNSYIEDTVRWATNALVWAGNGITYRIESSLAQDQATALVASLR